MFTARFFGTNPADDFRSIIKGLLAVEGALLPGESLTDDLRVRIDDQIFSCVRVVESHLRTQQVTTSDCTQKLKQ